MPEPGETKPASRHFVSIFGWSERPEWMVEQHLALVDEVSRKQINDSRKKAGKTIDERSENE